MLKGYIKSVIKNYNDLFKSKLLFNKEPDGKIIYPLVILTNYAQTKIVTFDNSIFIGSYINKKSKNNRLTFKDTVKNAVKELLNINIKLTDEPFLVFHDNLIAVCYIATIDFKRYGLQALPIEEVLTKKWNDLSQTVLNTLYKPIEDLFDEDRLFDILNEARAVKRTKTGKIRSTLVYGSLTQRIKKWKDEHGNDPELAFKIFHRKYIKGNTGRSISNVGQLQAGKIFTFDYKEPVTVKKGEYYDERPVILYVKNWFCNNTKNRLIMGLNLNFLEQYVRQDLLKTVYYRWRELYQKDGTTLGNKVLFSGDTFLGILRQMLTRKDYKKYVEPALRQYIWTRMKKVKRVNYGDWVIVSIMETETIVPFQM